jgi:hypothetical protein
MKLIQTLTVGSGGSTLIEFASIPGGYTDLMIALSYRGTGAGNNLMMFRANNITTASYGTRQLRGETSVTSETWGITDSWVAGMTGGTNIQTGIFSSASIYIPNYGSTTNKVFSSNYAKETNDTTTYENGFSSGRLTTSAAITSIQLTLYLNGNTFAQYSSASLFGITKGSLAGVTVS